jgi:tRNA threonylcarbamoyladenosine biosynthesis protein TsaB
MRADGGTLIILGLDTTSEQASVALRRDGATVAEEVIVSTDGHSHLLYGMIQQVLESAGIALEQVDCFASAVGPGSFTGVRICLTAAKGLADATGKRAIGVSNLRALAAFGTARLRNPILDARRGQIYTAVYNSDLELVSPETLTAAGEWVVAADVEQVTAHWPLASAIAWCAELDGPDKWRDPALLDASYIRKADAEHSWIDSGCI